MENQTTFSIGQFFTNGYEYFILCQVEENKVTLVSLESGNRWNDPVEVENVHQIDQSIVNQIIVEENLDHFEAVDAPNF